MSYEMVLQLETFSFVSGEQETTKMNSLAQHFLCILSIFGTCSLVAHITVIIDIARGRKADL